MTPTHPGQPFSRSVGFLRARPWCAVAVFALLISGCVTPWERTALLGNRQTTIDNVQGPTERGLRNLFRKEQMDDYSSGNGSLKPLAGTDDYLAAEELYEAEQYEEAGKAFHKVAKKFKKSEIREDAVFMEAESAYKLGHYARAQDKYSALLKDYPSTRHLDVVSQRLFEVARIWLDFPEAASLSEVQQVNYDDFGEKLPPEEPVEKSKNGPAFWPNLTDKSRPLFDPEGNGVGALRLIWLNDPTGPLADDALMLAASHYARTGDFIEADRHYTLLREEYPNSPHVQTAFVLGSHVKLMSYEGPTYDSKSLEDAEQLKESVLRLYPNSEDKDRVESELLKIKMAKAAREWEMVIFYSRKNNARGQAIYCHQVIQKYPETPFAKMARDRLKELGPEYVSGVALLNPQPDQPKYRQTFGRTRPALTNTPSAAREQDRTAEAESKATETPRRSLNPLQRERPPEEAADPAETPAQPRPPRRFVPWGGDEDSQPVPPPESPGNDQIPEEPPQQVSGENAADESTWRSRMLRFSPPRLLRPSREARPIEDSGAADEDSNAGRTTLEEP